MKRLVDRYDAATDRALRWAGKRIFDYQYSGKGALRSVQQYNPAEHFEHEKDYRNRIDDLLDQRITVLDEEPDTCTDVVKQMYRCQVDEAGYLSEKIGAGVGGVGSIGASVATGNPVGFVVGAVLLSTLPEGWKNVERVSTFMQDREQQQQHYKEAKQILDEHGPDALEDEISAKIHIPIPLLPTRHVDVVREEGIYYECDKITPGRTNAEQSRRAHSLAEGYIDT